MNGNSLIAAVNHPVDSFVADSIPPELTNFSLNLNSEVLTMTFNEAIRALSFDYMEVYLHNTTTRTADALSIVGVVNQTLLCGTTECNSKQLSIEISLASINNIKKSHRRVHICYKLLLQHNATFSGRHGW
jgi:hypothetical protein